MLKKWTRFLNRNDNCLPKHGGVCSRQFEDIYLKLGERTTLKWHLDPVPTIYINAEGMFNYVDQQNVFLEAMFSIIVILFWGTYFYICVYNYCT